MEHRGVAEFATEGLQGSAQCSLDLRYRGQGYELNVACNPQAPEQALEAFHRLHQLRYGFCDKNKPVEIVNLRLRMVAAGEPYSPPHQDPKPGDGSRACYATRRVYFDGEFLATRLYRRDGLAPGDTIPGPAMITEYTSATVLPPDAVATLDRFGNIILTLTEGSV
jgi:N-methylhydantoinase A